jgi:hypothetical protein
MGRWKESRAIGTGTKAYRAEPFYPPRGLSDIVCSGCMRRQTLLPIGLRPPRRNGQSAAPGPNGRCPPGTYQSNRAGFAMGQNQRQSISDVSFCSAPESRHKGATGSDRL